MTSFSGDQFDRLFSLISHELRTPITSLQGAIALLQMQRLQEPSEVDALLTLAADSTDRLTRLIENILDWYEFSHGSKCLFKQPCNIALLLQQAIESLQPFAIHQHIQIRLNTPTGLIIDADQYYLIRAFTYLLNNAIKFSPSHRSVWIAATVEQDCTACRPLEPPYIQITITDQGVGIAEADLEAVFHPFRQVDSSDTRCYGGLGLELTICREIVQYHQGKIWVESQLGQGTRVYVVLPMSSKSIA